MPTDSDSMYRWRRWTEEQRLEILKERAERGHPKHSPPHRISERTSLYLITAACFEHVPVIGHSDKRMDEFGSDLCRLLHDECDALFAWVVLPNHYHVLVDAPDVLRTLKQLGQLHGRASFTWNGEDAVRGRQVWCKTAETAMKSERHFYASLNYVLNNPVHHGYCENWIDWPFSCAAEYLADVGREEALRRWENYPLYDFGQQWDPAEL